MPRLPEGNSTFKHADRRLPDVRDAEAELKNIKQLTAVIKNALPAIPDEQATCHFGICAQEECARCTRIILAHNALRELTKAVR